MRIRERSSVERTRIALTEKRDILGDMLAAKREGLRISFIKNWGRKRNRQVSAGDSSLRESRGSAGRPRQFIYTYLRYVYTHDTLQKLLDIRYVPYSTLNNQASQGHATSGIF